MCWGGLGGSSGGQGQVGGAGIVGYEATQPQSQGWHSAAGRPPGAAACTALARHCAGAGACPLNPAGSHGCGREHAVELDLLFVLRESASGEAETTARHPRASTFCVGTKDAPRLRRAGVTAVHVRCMSR